MVEQNNLAWLEANGFIVGERDPAMNSAYAGRYMVAEHYEPGHAQEDGDGGVWCIVGDCLEFLIEETVNFWRE